MGEAGEGAELGEVGLDALGHVAEGELLVQGAGDLGQVLLRLGVEDDGGDVGVEDGLDPPRDLAERGDHIVHGPEGVLVHGPGAMHTFEPLA